MKADGLNSWRSDCCISLVLDFSLSYFIIAVFPVCSHAAAAFDILFGALCSSEVVGVVLL